jgi:ribosomal protein S27E
MQSDPPSLKVTCDNCSHLIIETSASGSVLLCLPFYDTNVLRNQQLEKRRNFGILNANDSSSVFYQTCCKIIIRATGQALESEKNWLTTTTTKMAETAYGAENCG